MAIKFFTPQQEALIPEYQAKWQQIALSTERIDRDKARQSVIEACKILGKKEPEIIFCASPFEALERLKIYIEQIEIPLNQPPPKNEDLVMQFPQFIWQLWQSFQGIQKIQPKTGTTTNI